MTTAYDPLGRLAAHNSRPYPAPAVSERSFGDYWHRLYRDEARAMGDEIHEEYVATMFAIETTTRLQADARTRRGAIGLRGYLVGPWEKEEQRRFAAIDITNCEHRLLRLNERARALIDEIATRRRAATGKEAC